MPETITTLSFNIILFPILYIDSHSHENAYQ